tara:strand:- start:647 stop:898 length:252 start_codon:yes stop_codon:yes gene_type:complete
MATKRKTNKKERPCGEGYKRVEVDQNDDPDVKSSNLKNKEKKFKCVKIRKPGIKPDPKFVTPDGPDKRVPEPKPANDEKRNKK